MVDRFNIAKVHTIRCFSCGKTYDKYQKLYFTIFTNSPYIKCPHCGKRRYLNFK